MDQSLPLLPLALDCVPHALRQLLQREGIPFVERDSQARPGRFLLFDSAVAGRPSPQPEQFPIDIARLRDVFAYDPLAAVNDLDPARYRWEVGNLTLRRRLPRTDLRQVRRDVMGFLRTAIERAGGVWIRVAAYPFPYRSAFNFRLDHGRYDAADFSRALKAIAGERHAVTHALGGAAAEAMGERLRRLDGCDVALLGDDSGAFDATSDDLEKIARSAAPVRAAGLEPFGFAYPSGRPAPTLLAALERAGLLYETGLAWGYDELPALSRSGRLLHLPAHPVTLKMFLEAARQGSTARWTPGGPDSGAAALAEAAVETAIERFTAEIAGRLQSGEPILLFGSAAGSLGRHPRALQAVLAAAADRSGLWKTTLAGWSAWWRARLAVQIVVERRGGVLRVTADGLPRGFRAAIEFCRERHVAALPLDEQSLEFSPEALAYENRRELSGPRPVRLDGPQDPRALGRPPLPRRGWAQRAREILRRWF